MLLEFTGKDDRYRVYTSIPFSIGLFFILSYYLVVLPKEKRKERMEAVAGDHQQEPAMPLEVAG
jgi:hypothetical protein